MRRGRASRDGATGGERRVLFGAAVDGHVAEGVAALRAGLESAHTRTGRALRRSFARELRRELASLAARTLVLELHVAKRRGQLHGATSAERFASYERRLRRPSYRGALMREYPVLADLLARRAALRAEAWLEFAGRLTDDADAIAALPGGGGAASLGTVIDVRPAGDSHRGGRAVLVVTFEGGARVVYKPRPVAVDAGYARLLAWLGADGGVAIPLAAAILDRGDYGWMQFVEQQPCTSRAEVHTYYARLGVHLALLYALDGTDLHLENVIAAGPTPVLIDLEALFHPRFQPAGPANAETAAIATSVLRVGLLPCASPHAAGVDRSGIAGAAGGRSSQAYLVYEAAGTDDMRAVLGHPVLGGAQNLPTLDGVAVHPARYAAALVDGFSATYRALIARRAALLAPDGPLAAFAGAVIRVVPRATAHYQRLLLRSLHPNVLRDAYARDGVLALLSREVADVPHLAALVDSEAADLRAGDVPAFTARTDSCAVWDARGARAAAPLARAPLDAVRAHVAALSRDDLTRQVSLIRASLATLEPAWPAGRPSRALPRHATALDPELLLVTCGRIARRLQHLAPRCDDGCWIGLMAAPAGAWYIGSIGDSLYDGRAGIALFLAWYGRLANDGASDALARQLGDALERSLERADDRVRATGVSAESLGAFSGLAGIAYVLVHLARLWGAPERAAGARAFLAELAHRELDATACDVIRGRAGLLKCVLAAHAVAPTAELLTAAHRCGADLLARALPVGGGLGWRERDDCAPLAGYSHGASGIAAALLALDARTDARTSTRRYREAALAAFAYERSLLRESWGNWPDLRPPSAGGDRPHARVPGQVPGRGPGMLAWCHGAPGVALARIEALRVVNEPALADDLDVAVAATLRGGLAGPHGLCHGALGNADIMMSAARAYPDAAWAPRVATAATRVVQGLLQTGPRYAGSAGGVEVPGLLAGLAGVGYGLLRLADPVVPCVLSLAPPPDRPDAG